MIGQTKTFKAHDSEPLGMKDRYEGQQCRVLSIVTEADDITPAMYNAVFPDEQIWPVWEDELTD